MTSRAPRSRASGSWPSGYAAFLSAPPLVGFVADRVGVLDAPSPAVVLLAAGALLAGACRPVRGG